MPIFILLEIETFKFFQALNHRFILAVNAHEFNLCRFLHPGSLQEIASNEPRLMRVNHMAQRMHDQGHSQPKKIDEIKNALNER